MYPAIHCRSGAYPSLAWYCSASAITRGIADDGRECSLDFLDREQFGIGDATRERDHPGSAEQLQELANLRWAHPVGAV